MWILIYKHCLFVCSRSQTDLEDASNELKNSEDNAKKAMADAAKIAEELRHEQDHASQIEKLRRALEAQVKELQARLDEAEASALKGGKKIIQKLEQRVRELEVELENESRRYSETEKNLRKQERRLKELAMASEEDHKTHERYASQIDSLQQKIKTYKRQVEEAMSGADFFIFCCFHRYSGWSKILKIPAPADVVWWRWMFVVLKFLYLCFYFEWIATKV